MLIRPAHASCARCNRFLRRSETLCLLFVNRKGWLWVCVACDGDPPQRRPRTMAREVQGPKQQEIPRAVGYAPQAPPHRVIGPDHAPQSGQLSAPVAVEEIQPPPMPAPRIGGLIDISKAPSSMEAIVAGWRK